MTDDKWKDNSLLFGFSITGKTKVQTVSAGLDNRFGLNYTYVSTYHYYDHYFVIIYYKYSLLY